MTEYFVRDLREEGMRVLWWKPDSAGYTTNLDEAGRYEREPPTFSAEHHIMVPTWLAEAATHREVKPSALHDVLAEATAILQAPRTNLVCSSCSHGGYIGPDGLCSPCRDVEDERSG